MSQGHLAALPFEVLHPICALLCPHCTSYSDSKANARLYEDGPRAPLTLCNSSGRLYLAAKPFLYHVTLRSELSSQSKLARTLHENPKLGALVKWAKVG